MKICDKIVVEYLENHDVGVFSGEWYYTSSAVAGTVGKNIFVEPVTDSETKEKVKIVYDTICDKTRDFLPTNVCIWDALFPDWREVLADISVDLIVGFPEPYDATVECDAEGEHHIIFDLICWSRYVGHCNLAEVVQNLVTHELCHALIHKCTEGLDNALVSTDYLVNLDAVTFDEAFAHLVSYEAKEIDAVNWKDKELQEIWKRNSVRLKEALVESDYEKQQKNLYEALCGNYYDKFACMCGMFYLADLWCSGGIPAIKATFEAGYQGFAENSISLI